jgi:TatA/E family protein of Tat protein translocase
MFGLGGGELLLLGIIALVFIGPKKLPELAKGLGRGIREFQKAKSEVLTEVEEDHSASINHSDELKHQSKEDIEIESVANDDSKNKPTS